MFRLSMVLMIVALVCGLTLALINLQTAPVIAQQKQALLERSLRAVLAADHFEKYEGTITYYEALDKDGVVLGWCLPLAARGYGGAIQVLAGVDVTGVITGVTVLEHRETPGLGAKIVAIAAGETEPAFLKQFKGKKNDGLILSKVNAAGSVQAITGATISSKAVLNSVREGVGIFLKDKLVL